MAELTTSTEKGPSTDERVRAATLVCIARWGITKTTLDDVSRESGVSRATIYRLFPGGKDVLVDAVLTAELERFFLELAASLDGAESAEDLLVAGIGQAMRFVQEHEALSSILEFEPELVLPAFAFHRLQHVLDNAARFAAPFVRRHVPDNDAALRVAEHLVRVVLSYTLYPSEHVDPFDDHSIRRLVTQHLVPALAAEAATQPTHSSPHS